MVTTIQLTTETKKKLERLKESSRETYEDVLNRLIDLAVEDTLDFSKETKEAIKRAREDIKKGRTYTTEEIIKDLGI